MLVPADGVAVDPGRSVEVDPALAGVGRFDQARHPTDLVAGDQLWVNLDHAQQGIGSASCGPGVLPAYRLDPAPVTFAVRLRIGTG